MIRSFADLESSARSQPTRRLVLAMAEEADGLHAVSMAAGKGLVDPILVGDEQRIREVAEAEGLDLKGMLIVQAEGEGECAARSVELLRSAEADVLMKGRASTSALMKAVLNRERGLRGPGVLSHVTLLQAPLYHKLLIMSDPGLNIAPDLGAKVAILANAVRVAAKLGIQTPKVAIIAAVEKVNHESMPATVDAAVLAKMSERGQLGDCIADGPLALDNAVSHKSCEVKNLHSPVGGDADILLMPDIEAANVFYKSLAYLTDCQMAGIVVGARLPLILPSRSDRDQIKYNSILAAVCLV